MQVRKVYAVVSVANLDIARAWYTQLLGRPSDRHPMAEVHEWYVGDGGLQLVADPARAGGSMLTLLVDNLDVARRDLAARGLVLGPAFGGDFATVAQLRDPDGNQVTIAQPGGGQRVH